VNSNALSTHFNQENGVPMRSVSFFNDWNSVPTRPPSKWPLNIEVKIFDIVWLLCGDEARCSEFWVLLSTEEVIGVLDFRRFHQATERGLGVLQ